MKRILVPTDLTETAEQGLKLAVEVARKIRKPVEIYVINFTKHPLSKTFSAMGELQAKADEEEVLFNIELLQSNRSKLNDLITTFSGPGISIIGDIIDDDLEDGVDAFLQKKKIDMVIMGTSGEENIKEQFTGNHTERLVKVSSCPVISVRDGFSVSDFKDIVLAVDRIEETDLSSGINALNDLAQEFNATVHLVHIADPLFKYTHRLEEYFTAMARRYNLGKFNVVILKAEDGPSAIIDYAGKIHAGLIAVLKNGDTGIFRIFTQHFSDRLVKEVGRPVFTFNLQNA